MGANIINTGGPAFPCECTNNGFEETEGFNHDKVPATTTCQYRGMSLRDYFAAKVAAGDASADGGWGVTVTDQAIADRAALYYRIADAMLAERAKGGAA